MIFHRIDRRNPEAITNRAVRGAAPALDHDVVFATEIDDVPDDQKIAGKPDLGNQYKFFFELVLHLAADRTVTLLLDKSVISAQALIYGDTHGYRALHNVV